MKNESQELILLKRPDGHVVPSEILTKILNSKQNLPGNVLRKRDHRN